MRARIVGALRVSPRQSERGKATQALEGGWIETQTVRGVPDGSINVLSDGTRTLLSV